ncbi:TadE-like protein [Isoptericola jiangsuensis]|uniref:TadE-like protein n=1 Tax=Isoptericola jiangsuensis TaxID=548579 RepID=A0A2A9ERY7_9MICO|nr:TadE family type IV pilus minor pilin [Isoptericola jiangsuensis]PFG41897.1 TadE-like protein [Isoptericola jiangsuensis]
MSRRDRERGSVTAELAVGTPVVVLLLVAVLTLVAASAAQLRAADAARAGARLVAVGEDDAAVRAAVARVGGADATTQVVDEGEWVRVVVTRPLAGGWLAGLPLTADAEAVAWVEP